MNPMIPSHLLLRGGGALTLSLIVSMIFSAFAQPAPTIRSLFRSDQNVERRMVWSHALKEWPRLCVRQRERPAEAPFSGCLSRSNAIWAHAALYRVDRLSGFIVHRRDALQPLEVIQSLAEPMLATRSHEERAALLTLGLEAIRATGDRAWLTLIVQVITHSPLNTKEEITCKLGAQCVEELIALLSAQQLIQHELSSQLLKLARDLIQPHPEATPHADSKALRPYSAWAHRAQLAALSLNSEELKSWWSRESINARDLIVRQNPKESQWGINSARAQGLGALIARGNAFPTKVQKLLKYVYHAHAQSSLELMIKNRRNYQKYGGPLAGRALLALTADRAPYALELDLPPQRWVKRTSHPSIPQNALPQTPLRASGKFSQIALRDQGLRRGLYFVRPTGHELLETELDFMRPDLLQVRYTQDMFAAYSFLPQPPKRALLIGLGGGAMAHAVHAYDPQLELDIVEIDPVVVDLARRYFGIQELETQAPIRIHTEDGFEYLKRDLNQPYDLIWMDAFLQPTGDTDSAGSPLNLKTRDFLQGIARRHLTPQGVIAININAHAHAKRDFDTLRATFKTTSIWQVPETGNYIALGTQRALSESADELRARAQQITLRHSSPFRYEIQLERVLDQLAPRLSKP